MPLNLVRACMGGWCVKRDHCQHYHSELRSEPSERLCIPGRDGISDLLDVQLTPPPPKVVLIASLDPWGDV